MILLNKKTNYIQDIIDKDTLGDGLQSFSQHKSQQSTPVGTQVEHLLVLTVPEVRAIREFQQYLIDPRENLATLDNYPDVKNLFFKYNTPIPLSALVERLFSIGNLLITARRNRLSDFYFQHVL